MLWYLPFLLGLQRRAAVCHGQAPEDGGGVVYHAKKKLLSVPSPSSSSSSSVSVLPIFLYLKDGPARVASLAAITRCHRPRRIRS